MKVVAWQRLAFSQALLEMAAYDVADSRAAAPFCNCVAISTRLAPAGPMIAPTITRSIARRMTPLTS